MSLSKAEMFKIAVSDPERALQFVRREWPYYRSIPLMEVNYWAQSLNQQYYERRGAPDGYDLMSSDWDTVVILDACRYDYFADANPIDGGTLQRETAPGSASPEFFRRTFMGEKFHDTVYVTGNPFITLLPDDTFHDVFLDESYGEHDTSPPPSKVTEAAIEAHEQYPNKRVIVHYMQPHFPVVDPDWEYVNDEIRHWRHIWWPVSISIDAVKQAYRANLETYSSSLTDSSMKLRGRWSSPPTMARC